MLDIFCKRMTGWMPISEFTILYAEVMNGRPATVSYNCALQYNMSFHSKKSFEESIDSIY